MPTTVAELIIALQKYDGSSFIAAGWDDGTDVIHIYNGPDMAGCLDYVVEIDLPSLPAPIL